MISNFFHRWEHQLHDVSKTRRVVRAFDWGLDWVPQNGHAPTDPPERVMRHSGQALATQSLRYPADMPSALLEIDAYVPDVRNAAAILHPHLAKL